MAEGTSESEEEFSDQFILDDDMDDLSLDDDALFADLDNEIRLDGDISADSGVDAPGDDIPDLDLELDSAGDSGAAVAAEGGDDLGDLDLDISLDEGDSAGDDLDISLEADAPAPDSTDVDFDLDGEDIGRLDLGAGDGLDDLAGGSDDSMDDLVIDVESPAGGAGDVSAQVGAGDGLDDLVIDDGPMADGLDDLVIDDSPSGDDAGELDLDIATTDDLDLDLDATGDDAGELDLDIATTDDLDLDLDATGDKSEDLEISTSGDDMNNLEFDDSPAGDELGDMGLDIGLDGGDSAGDDLDLDLDLDTAGASSAADATAGEDELGDFMADGDSISDSDLDDILSTGEPEADQADISDEDLDDILADQPGEYEDIGGIDLNALEDELALDDSAASSDSISVDEDLGDLDLSLGPDEVIHDLSSEDDAGDGENDLFLGEEELEVPPIEDGNPLEAAIADFSLDAADDLDMDSLDFDLDNATPGADEFEDGSDVFDAAPDMDISQLDAQLDALDSSILEEDIIEEDEELPIEFSQKELVEMGAEDGLEMPPFEPYSAEDESEFSAVADIDLEGEHVLELNLNNLDSSSQTFSNVSIPPIADYTGAQAVTEAAQQVAPAGISTDILLSIPHQVNVELGSVAMDGKDILELDYGSVVPLDRGVGEPVNLVLGGKAIAQGEIVLINGKYLGVRILAVIK